MPPSEKLYLPPVGRGPRLLTIDSNRVEKLRHLLSRLDKNTRQTQGAACIIITSPTHAHARSTQRNTNYGKDDKFCSFTHVVLDVFNQLLEVAVFEDISENTDELLAYLASTFDVEPTVTIK